MKYTAIYHLLISVVAQTSDSLNMRDAYIEISYLTSVKSILYLICAESVIINYLNYYTYKCNGQFTNLSC